MLRAALQTQNKPDPRRRSRWPTGVLRASGMPPLAVLMLTLTLQLATEPAMAAQDTPPPIDETVLMLYYSDLDAAAAFYGETLGLEATYSTDAAKLYRLTPTSVIGLILDGKGYHRAKDGNAVMLSIVTPDVDAWYERLRGDTGVTFLKPIGNSSSNPIRAFLIADPGGYTVEFYSWLPAAN